MLSLPSRGQLLWEVSGVDFDEPSYVYGTVHVGDERAYQFIDSLRPRMYQCDIMAGELTLDMGLMQNMQMMMALFMEGDTTLRDLLNEKEYALVKRKIDKKLHASGMIILSGMIEKIKPAFTSMMLMGLEQAANMQKNPQQSPQASKPPLDLFLQEEAGRMQKEVIGLETMEEQIGTFDQIPLKEQAQMLYKEMLADESGQGSTQESLEKMLDWYAAGRLDSLYQFSSMSMSQEMMEVFLNKRNQNMADRMEPYLKQGKSMFVAVGAAHLPGEQGLLELLRKKGYRVEAVKL